MRALLTWLVLVIVLDTCACTALRLAIQPPTVAAEPTRAAPIRESCPYHLGDNDPCNGPGPGTPIPTSDCLNAGDTTSITICTAETAARRQMATPDPCDYPGAPDNCTEAVAAGRATLTAAIERKNGN